MSQRSDLNGDSLMNIIQRKKQAIFASGYSQEEKLRLWSEERAAIESCLAFDNTTPRIVKTESTGPSLARTASQVGLATTQECIALILTLLR